MRAVGIICEYNPFHSGHAYHIRQAKELTGADYAVAIMSGDFVQRGEPAVFDKYTRAKQALEGGADAVFELPVRFCLSSAGDFATGAVKALDALGFITDLCFGSECGELRPLYEAARCLAEETMEFRMILNGALRRGQPFPAARAKALMQTADIKQDILDKPNNILGIEYCRALIKTFSKIKPVTIPREGMGYHETKESGTDGSHKSDGKSSSPHGTHPSSTALRKELSGSDTPHIEFDDFSDMIGYALRTSPNLAAIKDIPPDLADRIHNLLTDYRYAGEFAETCQTRSYTTGRIRRGMMQCLIGLTETDLSLPYLRLLGINKTRSKTAPPLTSYVKKQCGCQILTRLAADTEKLTKSAKDLLAADLAASDLYRQVYSRKYNVTLPNEYQRSPVVYDRTTS